MPSAMVLRRPPFGGVYTERKPALSEVEWVEGLRTGAGPPLPVKTFAGPLRSSLRTALTYVCACLTGRVIVQIENPANCLAFAAWF